MNPTLVLSILALLSGFGLRYWINRRKFYRRSPMGAEGFSSYEKSVFILFLERTGKWIAFILIVFGLLFFWSYSRQKKEKEEVVLIETQNPK
ncbi:molybdenum ABC transporter permease [Flavobacterium undicola]|uniref:molybdenum ABC transporter permease n=1 Tax=Flavobacterium undicola TaxID=1932779 RepID=UPI0013786AAB|nr:molybdenum ABC transporter permease [Flavobacterium undicola]MBA0885528.1 molybdenum ABC transporter permease [Flavobacterium undicola]